MASIDGHATGNIAVAVAAAAASYSSSSPSTSSLHLLTNATAAASSITMAVAQTQVLQPHQGWISTYAQSRGIAPDVIGTGLLLLINYLLVPWFTSLNSVRAKHLFSMVAASLSYMALFELHGLVQIYALSLVCYALVRVSGTKRWCPPVVFGLAMTVLAANHIYRQWVAGNDARMDHTAPMMILVMKITSFAWSYYDGSRPDSAGLSTHQKRCAIKTMPSFLEFLGYIFFFPAFLVGPTFAFVDYDDFVSRRGEFKVIPDTAIPAIECLAAITIPLYVALVWAPRYDPANLLDPAFIASKSPLELFVYLQIAGALGRAMFYVAWKAAEAACVRAGLGYNGRDPKTGVDRWDRVENCDIIGVEFCENPRALLAAWNKNTALWLREDVYLRLEAAGVSQGSATALTALASAFWHGVHLGYYLAFLTLAAVTTLARHLRRHVRPLFADRQSRLARYKGVYDVLGTVATHLAVNYTMMPFVAKDIAGCIRLYMPFMFAGHILLAALLLAFETMALPRLLARLQAHVKQQAL